MMVIHEPRIRSQMPVTNPTEADFEFDVGLTMIILLCNN